MEAGINYLVIMSVILIIAFLVPFERNFKNNVKYLIVFVSLIPLSIVASIRTIGTDTYAYKQIFMYQDIINFFEYGLIDLFSFHYEPGFLLIISILKSLSLDYHAMFFVFFIIPILLVIRVVRKAKIKNVLLVYTLFLLSYLLKGPMDIIRHFFAATLYLTALFAISQRKKIGSYLNIGIASFFHYSSLVAFTILPLLNLKWNLKRYLLVLTTASLMGIFIKETILNRITSSIDNESSFAFITKAQNYINTQFSSDSIYIDILLNLIMIMPIILNILIAIFGIKLFSNTKNNFIIILLKAQILGTIISIFLMSTGAMTAGYRMDFFLSIGNFILMYYIICYSKKNAQIYILLIFLYYLVACNYVLILYFIS